MNKKILHAIILCLLIFSIQNLQAQTVFPLNSTTTGSFAPGGNSQLQVTTNADGRLDLTLTSTGGTIIGVSLLAADGTTGLGGFNTGAGPVTWSRDGLAAGTYKLVLTEYYGNQPGSWILSNQLVEPAVANDAEPNDNYMQAQTLLQNDSVHGHIFYFDINHDDPVDWYKLKVNDDGMLKISLSNKSLNGNIVTGTLYDSTATSNFGGFSSNASPTTFLRDGLAPGNYYIAIRTFYQNGDYAAYTITDSLIKYNNASDIEPDNSPYQAIIMPANGTVTGHEGFAYSTSGADGADWYKLNYTGTGDLSFTFNQEPHLSDNSFGEVEFRLYSDTTQGAVYSTIFSTASRTDNLTGLAPGTYWILVNPSVNNAGFASYTIQNAFLSTLPVTFVDFHVREKNKQVVLSWSTSGEINNKGFNVQRSLDGQTFTNIGFVPASIGSSLQHDYTFTDAGFPGACYYRLQQTDLDGRFHYSRLVSYSYTAFHWVVTGNLSSANKIVEYRLDKSAEVKIQLLSSMGSVIQKIDKGRLSSGSYTSPLDMHNAAPGTYVIRLMIDQQSYSKMILK